VQDQQVDVVDAQLAGALLEAVQRLALGLAILVAVSTHAASPGERFSAALIGSTTLLTICLLVVLIVLMPAHRAAARAAAR
jgi:hypothetical protein